MFSSSIETLINLDKESKPWKVRKECFDTYIQKAKGVLLDIVTYLYKKEINKKNPLGLGGRLAEAYAELVRDMWIGSSNKTAPWEVKKVVGKRVTKFSGFG